MEETTKKIGASLADGFVWSFNTLQYEANRNAEEKGFWDKPLNDAEQLALMHSEISEALEYLRHDNPPDDKIPEFTGVEAELADVVIRIMSYAGRRELRIGEAIVAKMNHNFGRPHMHGGKKF